MLESTRPSWLCPRSRLYNRLPFRTQRTLLRLVGRQRNRGKRVERDVDTLVACTAIDDGGGPDDRRAGSPCDLDGLLRGSARGDHVLDDEDLLARDERKSSPQH